MHYIDAFNVAQALPRGVSHLLNAGHRENTRAGECLVAPGPVVTRLQRPAQRVLFSALRDANPFFHLVEALWMLAGRDDAEPLNRYVQDFGKRFAEPQTKVEDSGRIHGAYGRRWRHGLGLDQLSAVIDRLVRDSGTRQCVIQMWDSREGELGPELCGGEYGFCDLKGEWRDRPCNTHVYLRAERGRLHLTVCSRSHDIVWGLYGANAVHFSVLQEYLAARACLQIGELYFLSNNFHMYATMLEQWSERTKTNDMTDALYMLHDNRYQVRGVWPKPMFVVPEKIDRDVQRFFEWHDGTGRTHESDYFNPWFRETAEKVVLAHRVFKMGDRDQAAVLSKDVGASDWQTACREWIQRRIRT